ncbi:MAG: hypothetical protein WDW36_004365 [Sanguina aurantia]
MLERVERAAGLAAVAAPGGGGGARRVPVASTSSRSTAVTTVVDDSSLGLAGLSKELVRSKLAEAEAHRRLRVAARSEVELRQVLLQRDERITQLKLQHANGGPRGRTSHSHDFTTSALLRSNAPASGPSALPTRSRSASPLHPRSTASAFGSTVAATAAAAANLPSCPTTVGGTGSSRRLASGTGSGSASLELRSERGVGRSGGASGGATPQERPEPSWAGFGSDADAGGTAGESVVAALQRQLEGRDEDVRTLEAMLARANESATASRLTHQTSAPPRHHHTTGTLPPPPLVPSLSQAQHDRAVTERLRDRLAAANGSLAAAIAVAHALLRRLGNSSSSSSGSSSSHIQLQQQQLLQADTTALPATLNLAMANLESRIHKIQSTPRPSPLEAAAAGAASAGSSAPLPSSSGANALLQHQQQLHRTFNDKENGSRNITRPISDNVATLGGGGGGVGCGGGPLEVFRELVQLREQHELVLLERDSQAAQLASCELSLRLLQQQVGQQGAEDRAVQVASLSGSSHTVSLLQHSIATLHMCCGRMEGAAAGVAAGSAAPITAVASMGAEAGAVAHELCLLDTTLGLLGRQLGNAMRAPDEAAALAAAEADGAAAAAAAAQLHGSSDWPPPVPAHLHAFTAAARQGHLQQQPEGKQQQQQEQQLVSLQLQLQLQQLQLQLQQLREQQGDQDLQGAQLLQRRQQQQQLWHEQQEVHRQQQQEQQQQQEDRPRSHNSSAITPALRSARAPASVSGSAGPAAAAALAPLPAAPFSVLPLPPASSALQQRQHTTAAAAAAAASVTELSSRLQEQRERAEKWKVRCRQLGRQLPLGASAAAREAALCERSGSREAELEGEVARMRGGGGQAACAGAEAARRELESIALQRSVRSSHATASSSSMCGGDEAVAARLAEAVARGSMLGMQMETERVAAAGAAAARGGGAAAPEAWLRRRGERHRVVGALRDTLSGAKQAGDAEGRMRHELMQCQEALATARCTLERAQAGAESWRSEALGLRAKRAGAEQARVDTLSRLASRLAAAESHSTSLAAALAARLAELASRVEATAATAAGGGGCGAGGWDGPLSVLEAGMVALQGRLDGAEARVRVEWAAARKALLLRLRHAQAKVVELQREKEAGGGRLHSRSGRCCSSAIMTGHPTRVSFVGWDAMGHGAVSFAAPQVSAASAIRQSASLQEELAAAAQRAAHEACRTDGERQAVAERHAAHLTAMQERIADERTASAAEAAARAAAAAVAGQIAAGGAAERALLELQGRMAQALREVEGDRASLQAQLCHLQHHFSTYQAQKAQEVGALEARLFPLLAGGDSGNTAATHRAGFATAARPRLPAVESDSRQSATRSQTVRCRHASSGADMRWRRGGTAGAVPTRMGVCDPTRTGDCDPTRTGDCDPTRTGDCDLGSGSDSGWELEEEDATGGGGAEQGGRLQQILTAFRAATARSAKLAHRQAQGGGHTPLLARPLSSHTGGEAVTAAATHGTGSHGGGGGGGYTARAGGDGGGTGADGLPRGHGCSTRSGRSRNAGRKKQAQATAEPLAGRSRRTPHGGPGTALVAATAAAAAAAHTPHPPGGDSAHAHAGRFATGPGGPRAGAGAVLGAAAAAAAAMSALTSAGHAEAVAAARREAVFESLQRGAAESALSLVRQALGRVKARLQLSQRALEASRAAQIPPEDHDRIQQELSVATAQLRGARSEVTRHKKALLLLQGLPQAPSLSPTATTTKHPNHPNHPHPHPHQYHLTSSSSMPPPPFFAAPTGIRGSGASGGAPGVTDPMKRFTAPTDTGDGLLPAVASMAAAAAAASAAAHMEERAAGQVLEGRLRVATATIERKSALISDLRRRVEAAEGASAEQAAEQGVTRAALSVLREREASLQGTLLRKEGLLRELRERLEGVQREATRGRADDALEGERAVKGVATLKGELARKTSALKAALADLEKERQQCAAALHRADECSSREARAWRAAASGGTTLHRSGLQLVAGVRQMATLLLHLSQAARQAGGGGQSRPESLNRTALRGTTVDRHPGHPGVAASAATDLALHPSPFSAGDIAQLTSLSLAEVRDLLHSSGPATAAGNGDGNGSHTLQQVEDLLRQLEEELGSGRSANVARGGGVRWDCQGDGQEGG